MVVEVDVEVEVDDVEVDDVDDVEVAVVEVVVVDVDDVEVELVVEVEVVDTMPEVDALATTLPIAVPGTIVAWSV